MPGVAVHQPAAGRVEDAVKDGDEHACAGVGQHPGAGGAQDLLRCVGIVGRIGADEGAAERHVQGGAHPLVGHVGDDDPQPPCRKLDEIVRNRRRSDGQGGGTAVISQPGRLGVLGSRLACTRPARASSWVRLPTCSRARAAWLR